MQSGTLARPSLTPFAWLSVAAALATMGLKLAAWWVTGSVGLLSDALESLVNLAAAGLALTVLIVAGRPPDEGHEYGHEKAEFFASGAEGVLIIGAAAGIGYSAWQRLLDPRPVEEIGLGLGAAFAASLLNLAVARRLHSAGRRYGSIVLEADAKHLMTDVYTSAGVLVGVALVPVTGWLLLDPLLALLVGAHIVGTGLSLVRRSIAGLMDPALEPEDRKAVEDAIRRSLPEGVLYHALRTRQAGRHRFVALHVVVPGDWTVSRGHQLLETVESQIREALPAAIVSTHLEPLEDPRSFADQELYA